MEEIADEVVVTEELPEALAAAGETKKEPNDLEVGFHDSSRDKEVEDVPTMVDPVSLSNLENSFERLLQRQRSEIMFELRRLQYGDRPVTGQEQRRRTVENLVLRAVGPSATPAPGGGPRSVAAAAGRVVEGVPDHLQSSQVDAAADVTRPEHIVVEVNALVERRPVSSILSSLQFRRRLENSVRDALRTMTGGSSQGGSFRRTPPPVPRAENSPNSPAAAAADTEAEVQLHSSEVTRSSTDLSSVRSESVQSSAVAMGTRPDVIVVQPPIPGVDAPGASTGTTRAEEWIQQHLTLPADPIVGRQRSSAEILNQMHHEEFVVEISDLIHRQLVTSALSGGFRDVLERRMRRHMEASGIDGSRVQEQLRQLPRSTVHLRNDFIDLGIIPGAVGTAAGDVGDAMDDVSVISATAAVALPQAYAQNNVAIGREIHSLRTELQELKNMMRLSFDLQLDIQRSIRQEVAAALTQTLGGSSGPLPFASTTSGRSAATSGSSAERCLICDDHQVDTVLYQCGHLCLCHSCAMQLRQNGSNCPVCRAPIRDIMRTYRP